MFNDEEFRMITVKSIVYKPKSEKVQHGEVAYLRRSLTDAQLVADFGIEGDRKGGHPRRNLNVMDDITLAELQREGYPTEPGSLGENLILAGVGVRTLPQNAQLRIGSEAVIALVSGREPCEQLTPLDDRMPESSGVDLRTLPQNAQLRIGFGGIAL